MRQLGVEPCHSHQRLLGGFDVHQPDPEPSKKGVPGDHRAVCTPGHEAAGPPVSPARASWASLQLDSHHTIPSIPGGSEPHSSRFRNPSSFDCIKHPRSCGATDVRASRTPGPLPHYPELGALPQVLLRDQPRRAGGFFHRRELQARTHPGHPWQMSKCHPNSDWVGPLNHHGVPNPPDTSAQPVAAQDVLDRRPEPLDPPPSGPSHQGCGLGGQLDFPHRLSGAPLTVRARASHF